jgi:hypothetical protein
MIKKYGYNILYNFILLACMGYAISYGWMWGLLVLLVVSAVETCLEGRENDD